MAALFVWILINVVTQLLEKNIALLWFLIFCLIRVETDRPALFAKSSKTSPPLPSSPLHPIRTNYVWDNKHEELTKEFLLNWRCFLFGCLRRRPNKFLVAPCQKKTQSGGRITKRGLRRRYVSRHFKVFGRGEQFWRQQCFGRFFSLSMLKVMFHFSQAWSNRSLEVHISCWRISQWIYVAYYKEINSQITF